MLSRALVAGAVAVGGPVLWSGAANALAGPLAGAASSGGSGIEAAQVPLFSWRRSLPIDSMSPGIGPFGGTGLRALATMDEALYTGNGYWRDSQQANPAQTGCCRITPDLLRCPRTGLMHPAIRLNSMINSNLVPADQ
jgi:hypothetical protein